MAVFIRLALSGSVRRACYVNVDQIQQVRPLTKGVRIYWGTALPSEEGAYVDSDDYDESLDELVEKLRQAQVEVLP